MSIQDEIPAFWVSNDNFGDALTPYLVQKLTGKKARYVRSESTEHKYIITGSLLALPQAKYTTMWGPGVAYAHEEVQWAPSVVAVRGPISARKVVQAGGDDPVQGDPGLLLPRLYQPSITKSIPLGIIPSWVDAPKVKADYPSNFALNILSPVEDFVSQLLKCEATISSCLHGLIASVAYGIPTRWVEFSDKVLGDGTKFRDFLVSIGYTNEDPVDLRGEPLSESLLSALPKDYKVGLNLDRLMECCPFGANL